MANTVTKKTFFANSQSINSCCIMVIITIIQCYTRNILMEKLLVYNNYYSSNMVHRARIYLNVSYKYTLHMNVAPPLHLLLTCH